MAVPYVNSFADQECSFSTQSDIMMMNTIELLDEDTQNILSTVLKCVICLELPKSKHVLICEKGHHFCSTCHKRLKTCGVCRGKLLETRNFAVEELVLKLGPILGLQKNVRPPPQLPTNLCAGSYQCQHQCQTKTAAYQVIPHLRHKHSTELIDNVRSNPYSCQFSWAFTVPFASDEKHILSINVSDMGLFTIIIYFKNFNFFGFVKVLGDNSVSVLYRYQLNVKISSKKSSQSSHQFSISDCSVSSYLDDFEAINNHGSLLKINSANLLELIDVGSLMSIFFCVGKKNFQSEKKYNDNVNILTAVPKKPFIFQNDRKIRRNKNRNLRRKNIKKKIKKLDIEKSCTENVLVGKFSKLSFNRIS